ncbi:MAG: cytidine deaminase [Terrisporobacter sp.]|uniref:cytidine deaminase n=1 Tax=Terrisporobacter sp. TaxID=1965305 RepID=UPI002FC91749
MNQIKLLIQKAFEAQDRSYSPYSNFQVGAALLGKNGEIYEGCNIENASYTPTNCAERTAFFKAISEGQMEFDAIAIVGSKKDENGEFCSPCGVCRQVMMEFCNPKEFKIYLAKNKNDVSDYLEYTLEELLPLGFGPNNL